MLSSLSIQNIVLIERLELDGAAGLCALTGETGAGKSILLDALGLALGGRAAAGLVRHGAAQASVSASFDLPASHPARALLRDRGIEAEDTLILRRVLGADGRGKAFINDAPVSVQLLKETGQRLVEVHGQFETQGLLDPATHRATLDSHAGLSAKTAELRVLWDTWRGAKARLEEAIAGAESLKLQEDYLRHVVEELHILDPKEGEEAVLAEKRQRLRNAEKTGAAFDQAAHFIDGENGVMALLGRAEIALEKTGAAAPEALEALRRAKAEAEDASYQVERARAPALGAGERLEDIEERYFALRECAKKHRCATDDLPGVYADLAQKLRLITHQDDALSDLKKAVEQGRRAYVALAGDISAKRAKAAGKLAAAVQAELPALKLDRAQFHVDCAAQDEGGWGPDGIDRVQFTVATNPGAPAGPLHKIASGGELARFMLALKVVLARASPIPTLVFDEVDSGIGGAVADAVGERLAALARSYQVLVVTHSPQVAARARHHWHVAKSGGKGAVVTRITPLGTQEERREEIARMLSGAKVTPEARAQAGKLLESHDAAA